MGRRGRSRSCAARASAAWDAFSASSASRRSFASAASAATSACRAASASAASFAASAAESVNAASALATASARRRAFSCWPSAKLLAAPSLMIGMPSDPMRCFVPRVAVALLGDTGDWGSDMAVDAPRGMALSYMIGRPSDPMSCLELLRELDVVGANMGVDMAVGAPRGMPPPPIIGRPSDPVLELPRRMDIAAVW